MSCWSLLKGCIYRSVIFLTIITVISTVFAPTRGKFKEFHIKPSKPLTGKLSLNGLLNNTERLFENKLKGPEAFTVLNGELYTTLHGGYVAKIKEDSIIPVVKFGQPCENWWEEEKCGRPLGLTSTADGDLIVADAYYGIYKYNVKTGKTDLLVDKDTEIDGKKPKIFNSVAVGKDGTIYWTDSSTEFHLYNGIFSMLADPSGRLVKYDPKTNVNTVLLDKLYFANGIALSPNEDFVIVAESGRGAITRFFLKGSMVSQWNTFIDGLPGLPDNIRSNGKGGYYVALNVARDENNPSPLEYLSPYPFIRKLLLQQLLIIDWCMEQIDGIYPNYYTKRLAHFIGHFEMMRPFHPPRTTFIELDNNGNVIRSFHGMDMSVTGISDMIVHKGYLYLGSPYNAYLGRNKLAQL